MSAPAAMLVNLPRIKSRYLSRIILQLNKIAFLKEVLFKRMT